MNDDLLNELSMAVVKDHTDKIVAGAKDGLKKATTVLKDEYFDNVEALKILKRKFKGEKLETGEFIKALKQLSFDNIKLAAVAGITATPGSVITLPLAIAVADKIGINLIPTKTFN